MNVKNPDRVRLYIFFAVAYGITGLMSIPMYIGWKKGIDLSVFLNAQMLYPAAGVILGKVLVRKEDEKIPLVACGAFLATTLSLLCCTLYTIFFNGDPIMYTVTEAVIICGSAVTYTAFWVCGKEKRKAMGVSHNNIVMSATMITLFLLIFLIRPAIEAVITDGNNSHEEVFNMAESLSSTLSLELLATITALFPIMFITFLGEEYGWRYYLQDIMMSKFGKRKGIILLGIIWGVWHINADFMFYTKENGLTMFISQVIICIGAAIFFGYAYLKTRNIWVPVILHYINNNLSVLFTNGNSIQDQIVTWQDIPIIFIAELPLTLFILSPVFSDTDKAPINTVFMRCLNKLTKQKNPL